MKKNVMSGSEWFRFVLCVLVVVYTLMDLSMDWGTVYFALGALFILLFQNSVAIVEAGLFLLVAVFLLVNGKRLDWTTALCVLLAWLWLRKHPWKQVRPRKWK